jgi:N-acetyl sugar amidotransferase
MNSGEKAQTSSFVYCARCVMTNEADPDLQLSAVGLCNHCLRYDRLKNIRLSSDRGDEGAKNLAAIIKRRSQLVGSRYDCIIGLSGGVDSSYLALKATDYGLKPLGVHLDNGWNTELATQNIHSLVTSLNIDLVTEVLPWKKFSTLQKSFLLAGTPDGEIPTDHAIFATVWKLAKKENIPSILSGMNFATESINVPRWSYGHSDYFYIKTLANKFSEQEIDSWYPHFTFFDLVRFRLAKITSYSLLNYMSFDKDDAKREIIKRLGWRDYGGKHHESIYTRWYQGFYLPRKFNIDKRYGHLSDLINSGQITRKQALSELEKPSYQLSQQDKDTRYVKKRLKITDDEFEKIFNAKPKYYYDYPNKSFYLKSFKTAVNTLRKFNLYPK